MTPAELTLRLREKLKMNQTQLASVLGLTQPIVSRLENGDYSPTLAMIRRAAALGGDYREWAYGVLVSLVPDAFNNQAQLTLQGETPTLETAEKETQS